MRFNFLMASHFLLNWKEKTLKYGNRKKKVACNNVKYVLNLIVQNKTKNKLN